MTRTDSHYASWLWFILGWKTNPSSSGSNTRRVTSRLCMFVTIGLFTEATLWLWGSVSIVGAIVFSLSALWFFFVVILVTPFRDGADVNPARLLFDTAISTFYMIAVFSLWYRIFGILPVYSALDTIYFSAVTFSTLGYGDFKPTPTAQGFAAAQAILGNVHLGIIVGATLAAMQKKPV